MTNSFSQAGWYFTSIFIKEDNYQILHKFPQSNIQALKSITSLVTSEYSHRIKKFCIPQILIK